MEVEEANVEEVETRVRIHRLEDGSFVLWDSGDVQFLRKKCRVVGVIIGRSKGGKPALPLRLHLYEALLCEDEGFGEIFSEEVRNLPVATKEEVELFIEKRRLDFEQQEKEAAELDEEKRKERGSKGKGNRKWVGGRITQYLKDPNLPHVLPKIRIRDCIEIGRRQQIEFEVYCSLWKKGYTVVVGATKYGGDFLGYEGDVENTHSKFVVLVKEESECFTFREVLRQVRVANSVRKILLVATVRETNTEDPQDRSRTITYTEVEWPGWERENLYDASEIAPKRKSASKR